MTLLGTAKFAINGEGMSCSLKDWPAGFRPSLPSVGEELLTEFRFRNEPACLPEYRMKGTPVDFPVVRNGERLCFIFGLSRNLPVVKRGVNLSDSSLCGLNAFCPAEICLGCGRVRTETFKAFISDREKSA